MRFRHRLFLALVGLGLAGGVAAMGFLVLHLRPQLMDDLRFRLQTITRSEFRPDKPEHVGSAEGLRVHLLRRVADGIARSENIELDWGAQAELGVAVEHEGLVYASFEKLELQGQTVSAKSIRPLREMPGLQAVVFIKVESERQHYSNSNKTPGWWDDIAYSESVWKCSQGEPVAVDVAGMARRGVSWQGVPVGTMRFKAALEFPNHYLSTPGAGAVQRGGSMPGVLRISRKGNTGNRAVDEALALANLPYIWGSAAFKGVSTPSSHQAERNIGADCADLVVAAWRKAGLTNMRYSGAAPLAASLKGRGRAFSPARVENGIYRNKQGKSIPVGSDGVAPGAGIFWVYGKGRGHAGILVQDLGPDGRANGVLDVHDPVFHTSWSTPIIQNLGQIARGRTPRLAVSL